MCSKHITFGLKELTKSVAELMTKLPIPHQFLMKLELEKKKFLRASRKSKQLIHKTRKSE